MNPGTMIGGKQQQLEPILATDVCVFGLFQISRIMITHFGINNQTFTNGGAVGSTGTEAMVLVKNQGYFFTMHGMNTL
jgi:hypothetical protein